MEEIDIHFFTYSVNGAVEEIKIRFDTQSRTDEMTLR